jgi:hypothetical protein
MTLHDTSFKWESFLINLGFYKSYISLLKSDPIDVMNFVEAQASKMYQFMSKIDESKYVLSTNITL